MSANDDFVRYLGSPDVHDGVIVGLHIHKDQLQVVIRACEGRVITIELHGVVELKQHQAQGMMLYALAEMKAAPPLRRFVFVNWDDDSAAFLEVMARDLQVLDEQVSD